MPSEDIKKGAVHVSRYLYITFERLLRSYLLKALLYINVYTNNLSVYKISKTYVFFLKTSDEYLTRYGQMSRFHSGSGSPSLIRVLKNATKVEIDI